MHVPDRKLTARIPLSKEDLAHILDGDEEGGGHRFGAGKRKSEFPPGWDEDKIVEVSDEIQARLLIAHYKLFEGKFEAVIHRVRVRMYLELIPETGSLVVSTMFPIEGDGVTIWSNGKRKPKPLQEPNAGVTL